MKRVKRFVIYLYVKSHLSDDFQSAGDDSQREALESAEKTKVMSVNCGCVVCDAVSRGKTPRIFTATAVQNPESGSPERFTAL